MIVNQGHYLRWKCRILESFENEQSPAQNVLNMRKCEFFHRHDMEPQGFRNLQGTGCNWQNNCKQSTMDWAENRVKNVHGLVQSKGKENFKDQE